MKTEIWIAFVTAVLILMSTPGPSQLLVLSNTIGNGFRRTTFTIAGDLSANLIQMAVASVGLVSLIQNSKQFFTLVKWAGVLYLVYLGIKLILSKTNQDLSVSKKGRSSNSLYWQGFSTSMANPKAVVFFAALFPQFINPGEPLFLQFIILSITYLTLDGMVLSLYGTFAQWIGTRLSSVGSSYLGKVSGALLIGAALLLGMKDMEVDQ